MLSNLLKNTSKVLGLALALCSLNGTISFASENKLQVYTYDAFAAEWGPGPAIEKAFETQCDCDLEFVALDSSVGILSRIKLEGEASQADVVLGLDTNLMVQAAATGLLAPHEANTGALSLPTGEWTNDTFVPFDFGYFAFVYKNDRVATVPTSFEDLVESHPDLKIVIQDPRSSTPGLGLMLWIKAAYGDRAQEIWKGLAPKIVTVTKSWSDAYFNLFLNDEADMVLSYTTSPAYHTIVEEDQRFQAAAFEEGHYTQIELAARLKSSDQPELSKRFMQFIMEKGFQDAIPTGNWMYPVLKTDLPAGFDTLIKPTKSLLFSPEEVVENSRAWLDEWLILMSN